MKATIPLAVLALLAASCQKKEAPTPETAKPMAKATSFIAAASWLEGRWENRSKDGILSEIWKKETDSLYKGESYFVVGQDTVFSETVDLLLQPDGNLDYIVSVVVQNNEKPVAFRRTSGTETELVFENPAHDYPTKIVYERHPGDSLVATISGVKKGKPTSEVFRMKKVQ